MDIYDIKEKYERKIYGALERELNAFYEETGLYADSIELDFVDMGTMHSRHVRNQALTNAKIIISS